MSGLPNVTESNETTRTWASFSPSGATVRVTHIRAGELGAPVEQTAILTVIATPDDASLTDTLMHLMALAEAVK
jgi:hypothetical protein